MSKYTIPVTVINRTGSLIQYIKGTHRYDSDVTNILGPVTELQSSMETELGSATFWYGFMRTGTDYWWIQFLLDGVTMTCKANFACMLTDDDAEGEVTLSLYSDKMVVTPPMSSECTVSLYSESALHEMITKEHESGEKSSSDCDCK